MFPDGDLSRMQATQEAHMPDTCHRWAFSSAADEYNQQVESWTENGTDIVCGLEQEVGTERVGQDKVVVSYDATIRLPIAQAEVWSVRDQLTITKRFGSAITPIKYSVVAPVQRGPSGIRLLLQKLEV
jgi:hypothetical protein